MNFTIPSITGLSGKEEEPVGFPHPLTIFVPYVAVTNRPEPRVDSKLFSDYKRLQACIVKWKAVMARSNGVSFAQIHPLAEVVEAGETLVLRLRRQLQDQMMRVSDYEHSDI